MDPSKYIVYKMEETYGRLFTEQPNDKVLLSLIKVDHLELNCARILRK